MDGTADNTVIAVLSFGLSPAQRKQAWARVASRWPLSRQPRPRFLDLGSDATAAPVKEAVSGAAAALVLLAPEANPGRVSRLAELLGQHQYATVTVCGDAQAVTRLCRPETPVVFAWDADPAAVAGALHAVARRQHAVNHLHGEVRLQTQLSATAARELMKLHDEIDLAAMLQREMLPRELPSIPGWDVSVLFRPCGMLSGDTYDLVNLDDHHLGFLLADAAGHGVSAALLMMLVSRLLALKDPATGRLVPPGEAMTRLNDAFIERRGDLSSLVSAVCGVIDTRTGTLHYASAGHPPAVLAGGSRGDGGTLLTDGGPLLGAMPGFQYPEGKTHLGKGQVLLLYTDGVEEAFACPLARRAGMPQTQHVDVLGALGSEWQTRGPAGAVEQFAAWIDGRDGSLHQADDITLLAIGRTAIQARAAA